MSVHGTFRPNVGRIVDGRTDCSGRGDHARSNSRPGKTLTIRNEEGSGARRTLRLSCVPNGCEEAHDEERQQSLDGCIDLLKRALRSV